MADMTANTATASTGFSLISLFEKAYEGLVRMGENTARARAIEALSKVSDEELAAKGTTRHDEVMRIFGAAAYI